MIPDTEPDPDQMSFYVGRAYFRLTSWLITTQAERHKIAEILSDMQDEIMEDLY